MGRSNIVTISLDEVTRQIAKEIPNFSEWVRMQLYLFAHNVEEFHLFPPDYRNRGGYQMARTVGPGMPLMWSHQTFKCNPFSKRGRCFVCWPIGEDLELQLNDFWKGVTYDNQPERVDHDVIFKTGTPGTSEEWI